MSKWIVTHWFSSKKISTQILHAHATDFIYFILVDQFIWNAFQFWWIDCTLRIVLYWFFSNKTVQLNCIFTLPISFISSLVFKLVIRIASTWLQKRFLSYPGMPWFSHSCNDRRWLYFTRNICKQYINSFKTLFRTWSQACSAISATIWRSGFTFIEQFT